MKTLILTGDDFGRSAAINAAFVRHHAAGLLTQASLMVNEPAAVAAAVLARQCPALCVGLHLTLCAGRAAEISALTNARGDLAPSPAWAGLRYFFRPSLRRALTAEIRAQFAKFRAFGLPPTYWDGHTHLHLHPTLLALTLPIAREHGFRAMRLLREPVPRSPLGRVFGQLSNWAAPHLNHHGMGFADQVCGLRETGRMTTERLLALLAHLPDGVTEIYYHPGAEPADLDPAPIRRALDAAAGEIQLTNSKGLGAA